MKHLALVIIEELFNCLQGIKTSMLMSAV